jgi:hypothetical protein
MRVPALDCIQPLFPPRPAVDSPFPHDKVLFPFPDLLDWFRTSPSPLTKCSCAFSPFKASRVYKFSILLSAKANREPWERVPLNSYLNAPFWVISRSLYSAKVSSISVRYRDSSFLIQTSYPRLLRTKINSVNLKCTASLLRRVERKTRKAVFSSVNTGCTQSSKWPPPKGDSRTWEEWEVKNINKKAIQTTNSSAIQWIIQNDNFPTPKTILLGSMCLIPNSLAMKSRNSLKCNWRKGKGTSKKTLWGSST